MMSAMAHEFDVHTQPFWCHIRVDQEQRRLEYLSPSHIHFIPVSYPVLLFRKRMALPPIYSPKNHRNAEKIKTMQPYRAGTTDQAMRAYIQLLVYAHHQANAVCCRHHVYISITITNNLSTQKGGQILPDTVSSAA